MSAEDVNLARSDPQEGHDIGIVSAWLAATEVEKSITHAEHSHNTLSAVQRFVLVNGDIPGADQCEGSECMDGRRTGQVIPKSC